VTAPAHAAELTRFATRSPKVRAPIECVTPADDGQYFVGYYDKNPWSAGGKRLLAHRAQILDREPTPSDIVDLGAIDLEDPAKPFHVFARSSLWNWQQGTMLRWMPGSSKQVIYNVRQGDPDTESLDIGPLGAAVIHDLETGQKRALDRPCYVLSPDGESSLSLSFARLAGTRPDYGHAGVEDPTVAADLPEDDGVWRTDVASGRSELILPIAPVAAHDPVPFGEGRRHWVNHLMINPSGTRFCFLHRFWRPDGNMHTRLFTAAMDGADLRLVMQGMVSHYDWLDDHTLVAWAGERRLLALGAAPDRPSLRRLILRSLKPIYYALGKPRWMMRRFVGDSYMLLRDDGRPNEKFAQGELVTDGHCTVSRDRRWLLTDGYTIGDNELPLFMYRMPDGPVTELGRFPTPRELDGPVRCDLHPRFNQDATKICVDTAFEGARKIHLIDVSSVTRDGGA